MTVEEEAAEIIAQVFLVTYPNESEMDWAKRCQLAVAERLRQRGRALEEEREVHAKAERLATERIDALEAENERLRKLITEDQARHGRVQNRLMAEVSALEAALSEAIAKYDSGAWRHEDIFKLARAALATAIEVDCEHERLRLASLDSLLIDIAQLLSGWSQDGSAWSAHDQSVLDRVRAALAGRGK